MDQSRGHRSTWGRYLSALAAALAGLMVAMPAAAQWPEYPEAYIYGVRIDKDFAGPTRGMRGDGRPDVAVKVYFNNIPFWTGKPYNNAVTFRYLKIYNKMIPSLVWDTIPNSPFPPLMVELDGRIVNRGDGGIEGLTIPNWTQLELLVNDSGPLAQHRGGFVLEIVTFDGKFSMPIAPFDIKDMSLF